MRVLSGLFEASLHFDQHRLPELFCGFPRREGEGPTLYPVACSPQAWAAAARVLHAAGLPGTGRRCRQARRSRCVRRDCRNSSSGCRFAASRSATHSVDLLLQRYENNVGIEVMRNDGKVSVGVAL